MPSTFSTSRDYSRGPTRATRLAQAAMYGDPGPSPFTPGTVSGGSVAVKLAHAIFAHGSQQRATAAREEAAVAEQEKADLGLQILRHRADPNFRTAHEAWMESKPATEETATPRAPVHLGAELAKFYGLGAEGDYDPDQVSAAKGMLTEKRLQTGAKRMAEHRAATERTHSNLAGYRASLSALDDERKRAVDAALEAADEEFETHRGVILDPKSNSTARAQARAALGLSSPGYTQRPDYMPANAYETFIRGPRAKAERDFDTRSARKRQQLRDAIERESGTLDALQSDPELESLRNLLQSPE